MATKSKLFRCLAEEQHGPKPAVPVRWTVGQALAALALELDPELVRALTGAGEDPQWHITSSRSMLDWVPAWRLVERRQRFLGELLRRVQAGAWRLIVLPDDLSRTRPFPSEHLAELAPEDFDPERSEVIVGPIRYRVRIEMGQSASVPTKRSRLIRDTSAAGSSIQSKQQRTRRARGPAIEAMEAEISSGKRTEATLIKMSGTQLASHYGVPASTGKRAREEVLRRLALADKSLTNS